MRSLVVISLSIMCPLSHMAQDPGPVRFGIEYRVSDQNDNDVGMLTVTVCHKDKWEALFVPHDRLTKRYHQFDGKSVLLWTDSKDATLVAKKWDYGKALTKANKSLVDATIATKAFEGLPMVVSHEVPEWRNSPLCCLHKQNEYKRLGTRMIDGYQCVTYADRDDFPRNEMSFDQATGLLIESVLFRADRSIIKHHKAIRHHIYKSEAECKLVDFYAKGRNTVVTESTRELLDEMGK